MKSVAGGSQDKKQLGPQCQKAMYVVTLLLKIPYLKF